MKILHNMPTCFANHVAANFNLKFVIDLIMSILMENDGNTHKTIEYHIYLNTAPINSD